MTKAMQSVFAILCFNDEIFFTWFNTQNNKVFMSSTDRVPPCNPDAFV